MPLATGQTLSFYEILDSLGAGGMGEVYRAVDTRLEREVAIKVLPEEMAGDEERLRRFEREAKTLASLNHPNVAGIHGVDQQGDVCFLALELVPGEDLAERLAQGPLPVEEALEVCRQIAVGLEAAHEAGVVHRDLKPANVRVTPEGVVKLLDFGLAKPMHPRTGQVGTTTAQADSFLMTEEGLVMGTPTYMSPEQARGKPVDRRTDIWAFGCVLYECLTGRRVFHGETFGDVVASVVSGEPDWSALPPLPRRVHELLRRALTKDPQTRLRDMGEARVALELARSEAAEDGAELPAGVAPPEGPSRPGGSPATWLAVAAIAALAASVGWWLRGDADVPVERWSTFSQLTDLVGAETGPSLSPDGGSFAYASQVAGSWDIYVQRVGGRNRTAVAADPERDEAWPAFSPDGSLIAYNESDEEGGIWIVGATGESHRRITDFGFNPAWSPDGEHIAFATQEVVSPHDAQKSTLWRVAVDGGEPVKLSDEHAYQPAWSPSGKRIAIWFQRGGQRDLATVPRTVETRCWSWRTHRSTGRRRGRRTVAGSISRAIAEGRWGSGASRSTTRPGWPKESPSSSRAASRRRPRCPASPPTAASSPFAPRRSPSPRGSSPSIRRPRRSARPGSSSSVRGSCDRRASPPTEHCSRSTTEASGRRTSSSCRRTARTCGG